ncbi:MAG: holo-ACP synthase [Candidatus Tectomicrobia bacterium]|uniref:Holo-[acyl-carrier-protein] synthase n=1 Tax=Tectimicrobiota bacterium TaxID=2528274 RepID=A0A932MM54_UNCTE|nr:holo-ACP synthase [Candidatus Tectomicrobia bacterium]
MRIYQGVDLAEVGRVREAWERTQGFRESVFTEAERTYCLAQADPFPHLAARFAVKEACLKAFGVGLGAPGGLGALGRLREVEVESSPSGRPLLRLHGSVEKMGRRRRITQSTVSISHTREVAVASVILVGEDVPDEEEI